MGNALAEAARARSADTERAIRAECRELKLGDEQRCQIRYIERQIDLGTREDEDIVLLKTRRKQIMAEASR